MTVTLDLPDLDYVTTGDDECESDDCRRQAAWKVILLRQCACYPYTSVTACIPHERGLRAGFYQCTDCKKLIFYLRSERLS